jgi:anti-anti-sigma regulatory factor
MFSFFKKKKDEPPKPSASEQAAASRANSVPKELVEIASSPEELPQPPPLTPKAPDSAYAPRQNAPIGVDPKALARAAVAKIDAIESEMSLDFVGRKGQTASAPKVEGGPKVLGGMPAGALKPVEQKKIARGEYSPQHAAPALDSPTALLLGDTALSDAIELAEGTTAPAVEEAAVLYANRLPDAAADVLKSAIAEQSLGRSEFSAYQMLFDLLHMQGNKYEYEKYALDFVVKFEQSAPAWTERVVKQVVAPVSNAPVVIFKDALDASIVPQLERIKQLAAKHSKLKLEFSSIKTADVVGCELMMRVLTAFSRASHELDMTGTDALISAVRQVVEVGRRDASPAAWLLLMELYRIVDRQQLFEDIAVDYCVTYEVSPPSWEPAPRNMRVADVPSLTANTAIEGGLPDEIPLQGEVTGNGEALIKTIEHAFRTRSSVTLNCKNLDRVEFGAAGSLVQPLTQWNVTGKHVDFRNLNHLVAGLFVTLGLHQIAGVERRKGA